MGVSYVYLCSHVSSEVCQVFPVMFICIRVCLCASCKVHDYFSVCRSRLRCVSSCLRCCVLFVLCVSHRISTNVHVCFNMLEFIGHMSISSYASLSGSTECHLPNCMCLIVHICRLSNLIMCLNIAVNLFPATRTILLLLRVFLLSESRFLVCRPI